MADNYLETRYEEIFGKGSSPAGHAPGKPSLDTLLKRTANSSYDLTYKVHPLQADAIVRTVESVFDKGVATYESNSEGIITFTIHSTDLFLTGKIGQVIELKAAEMGLGVKYLDHQNIELIKTV